MAALVEEIMNLEVFTLRPDETAEDALSYVLALGITGAPVIDDADELVGMISIRDLLGGRTGKTVGERMATPAATISKRAPITEAGKLMGETGYHRLAVTDESGQLVGVLSTIDVVRGLTGLPASHPSTFPHYDPETGVTWTDDHALEFERVEAAPDGPGVIALIRGGPGVRESLVWVEVASHMRRRLIDLLSLPEEQTLMLRKILAFKALRFRAAAIVDPTERERVALAMIRGMRANFGPPD